MKLVFSLTDSAPTFRDILGSSNNCTVPDLGSCPALQAVNPLVTSAVAEFMTSQSFIANNDLTVVMESPAVSQRYISYVGLSSSACAFPNAGQVFSKGFDTVTCQDSFTVVFSVQDLVSTCGFAVTSDSATAILRVSTALLASPGPSHSQE